ncbi:putative mitochondrial membrane protein [Lachnellula subtilissima]|uniref:Putative mitochondrial membrane protein n=1 Tax=Lachnellula subtilissima TaxID=602034 RepID=A0A8H8RLF2_9HELO|nr:putative mitochondrial membrane protein [Lachnellula subtilissima]
MASVQPLPFRIAQTVGLTSTGLLAGISLSFTLVSVPRLLESPAPLLLRQWTHLYNEGKVTVPPLTIVASTMWAYLAYGASKAGAGSMEGEKYWGYVAAGVLSALFVPYTVLVMKDTNAKLLGRGNLSAEEIVKEESVHQLVDRWGLLNLGRGTALLASVLVGAWTIVS